MFADLKLAASFVNARIGKPWASGGIGPDEFDCWGLTRVTQHVLFGRTLPIISEAELNRENAADVVRAIKHHDVRMDWELVERPEHGSIVTAAHHVEGKHIGTWLTLDRGGLFHCTRKIGTTFDALAHLKLQGWMRLEFYRFRGART